MIKFYGASDDLFKCDGGGDQLRGCETFVDEVGCFDCVCAVLVGTMESGLIVSGVYAPKFTKGGAWFFGVSQVDEGIPIPWECRIINEHDYSVALIVDAPAGTPVSILSEVVNAK